MVRVSRFPAAPWSLRCCDSRRARTGVCVSSYMIRTFRRIRYFTSADLTRRRNGTDAEPFRLDQNRLANPWTCDTNPGACTEICDWLILLDGFWFLIRFVRSDPSDQHQAPSISRAAQHAADGRLLHAQYLQQRPTSSWHARASASSSASIQQRNKSDITDPNIQSQAGNILTMQQDIVQDAFNSDNPLLPVPWGKPTLRSFNQEDQDNNCWENKLGQLQTKAVIASQYN